MRGKSRSYFLKVVGAIGVLLLTNGSSTLFAQAPAPIEVPDSGPTAVSGGPTDVPRMSADQLDGLVAPIALYPDPLLSQVLVAATYPLEIVEANQWLQRNAGLAGPALTQAAQAQNWDPSVQALVMFPDVLKHLTEDINWTTSLGNAFLTQQADVMGAVQHMRLSAQQQGKLTTTPQQQVATTTEGGQPTVVITPTNPEVIYVPEYDPYWVWGPAAYYPYPGWYPWYPRRSGFFFGAGIGIGGFFGVGWGGWGGWGWHPSWGNRTVIVNNNFIRRNNFNSAHFDNRTGRSNWNGGALRQQGFRNSATQARSFAAPSRQSAPLARSFAAPSRQSATQARSFAPSNASSRQFAPQARSFAPSRSAPSQTFRSVPQQSQTFRSVPQQSMARPQQAAPNFQSRNQGSSFRSAPTARSAAPSSRSQSSSRAGGGGGGGQHRGGGGHAR